jgi:GTP-dependent phosphoenolpyruvate carboxykinase
MDIARDGVLEEAAAIEEYFGKFGGHLPPELEVERKKLQKRAESAPGNWSLGG